MKPVLHKPRYLILIGFTVLLCITGITFFIGNFLAQRITRISEATGNSVANQKLNVFSYEFKSLLKGTELAAKLFSGSGTELNRDELNTLNTLLLADIKTKHAWYAILKGNDTVLVSITRAANSYKTTAMPVYLKEWVKQQFSNTDTGKTRGIITAAADTLHWISSSPIITAGSAKMLFGLDLNLKDLQHSFYNIDSRGVSYAFIVDEYGLCIFHPNDSLIGKSLFDKQTASIISKPKTAGKLRFEKAMSDYLKVEVLRYYIPYAINGMKWTIVVDIPAFAFEDDVAVIRTYSFYMGMIAVSIILGFIILYQRKWQKEFLLRRQVEIRQQEISMEKQALNLIAERQQKENVLLQLNKLKEKVNPHFLFNSLSSLNSLIVQDPELAKSFVVKLSRVYRYVLESYPNGLATVAEELKFVNEYFFLLKIRFGDALQDLELHLSEDHMQEKIPFMSLQTLIENAVKHNILSKTKPLHIRIESKDNYIIVSNNLQLRSDVRDSGKQGLSYLQSTYAYFGEQQLKYGVEGNEYKCYLPVLKSAE